MPTTIAGRPGQVEKEVKEDDLLLQRILKKNFSKDKLNLVLKTLSLLTSPLTLILPKNNPLSIASLICSSGILRAGKAKDLNCTCLLKKQLERLYTIFNDLKAYIVF
jgi:hypothetical protein